MEKHFREVFQASHEEQGEGPGSGTAVISRSKTKIKEPSLYKVFLHNDDYTPMDFVVGILETVFNFDNVKANKIMLDVHHKGLGLCGAYPYEIAETKVAIVTDSAREHEYPLKCSMEKD
ncbi:MAG: ATP-dependent Clp protease adapter ClpS [Oligoflexales bacterium]|nr:ATP-dependent Clp protease adapter ClpS [Oligoflexales bacterium]